MSLLIDSFWRALAYCLLPRVMLLSLLPLIFLVGLSAGLGYFYWEAAVAAVQNWLSEQELLESMLQWVDGIGATHLRNVLAPFIVLSLAVPVLVIVALLAVAWLMTPAIVSLVAQRRFPGLVPQHGGSFIKSALLGVGSSLLAGLAMVISMPLWFIPPLVMILPPLIWGWLTYRVMCFDVLSEHASDSERRVILRRHRGWLLGIGICTGYLGAAPGLIWALGAVVIVMAPLLIPLAVWIYTFVFAFSALWFAHYCLATLEALRSQNSATSAAPSEQKTLLLKNE